MGRRTRIKAHLSAAELSDRYRVARDSVERTQFHMLWLLTQGRSRAEVASITGYSPRWVSDVIRRYNAGGPNALGDHRHANPGAAPLLSLEQQDELRQVLLDPAPYGGPWRSRDVSEWIATRTGRIVPIQRGWAYLKKLGPGARRRRLLTDWRRPFGEAKYAIINQMPSDAVSSIRRENPEPSR